MQHKIFTEIKNNGYQLLLISAYTILVVFFCSKMSPFYPIQEWSDINLYFNVGKAVMHGQTLYTESFDHKGPIIFFIYGIGYLLSQDSFLGMFVIESLAWIILTFVSYFMARLFLNKICSFIVAAIFLPVFISHTLEGGSAEEFVSVFLVISLYLFIRYFRDPKTHSTSHMYIHGMMWGLVFFTKFNLVVFWVFPLLAIGVILIYRKEHKSLIINIFYFIIGVITITLPILIYFIAKGALYDAYDIYISLNTGRVEAIGTIINNVAVRFYQRLRFETLEFTIILLGAFVFPILYIKDYIAKIAIALSFLSLFAIIFMATGYVYYYSIPYYIFSILGLIVIISVFNRLISIKDCWYIYALVTLFALSISIYRKDFFGKHNTYQPEQVVVKFSERLIDDKDATLLNLGLDNANAVFTYANIMPNVQYFLSPNFTYDAYPKMRDEQTLYIENKKTKYIILTEYSINFEYFNNLSALKENYEVIDSCKEYFSWVNDNRTYYLYKRIEK